MASFSAHASATTAPGSVMPVAQRYWASGKDGIVVRGLMSLDSKVVGDLACGAPLSVMGFGELPCGKRRARLVHPVKGWCSAKLISPAGTPAWDLPRRPDGSRPRVLCLHGGATSGAIFRAQLHAIVEDLKEAVDFVFEDGPLSAPTTGPEAKHMRSFFPGLVKGGLFSWMSIVEVSEDGKEEDVVASVLRRERDRAPGGGVDDDLRSGVVHGSGAVLVGTKDAAGGDQQYRDEGAALKRVLELVRTHRPDGIVGFSQGANVAALLFAALQAGHASVPSPPAIPRRPLRDPLGLEARRPAPDGHHPPRRRPPRRRLRLALRHAPLRGEAPGPLPPRYQRPRPAPPILPELPGRPLPRPTIGDRRHRPQAAERAALRRRHPRLRQGRPRARGN